MGFYLHRDGQTVPYDLETLRTMARKGDLRQDEYIYIEAKGEWIGAALVPEMAGAWNIEESEATVAMEIPAEFFANLDGGGAAPEPEPEPEPAPAPAPRAPAPAPMPAPAPAPRAPAPAPAPAPQQAAPQQAAPQQPRNSGGNFGGGGGGGGNAGGGRRGNLQPGEILNPIKVLLLGFVTCGIYLIIWMYKRILETNTFLGREEIKPMHFFLGFLCSPLILLCMWKLIKALPEMGQKAGVQIEDRATLLLILMLCFPYGFYYLVQQDLNAIWEASGAKPAA